MTWSTTWPVIQKERKNRLWNVPPMSHVIIRNKKCCDESFKQGIETEKEM